MWTIALYFTTYLFLTKALRHWWIQSYEKRCVCENISYYICIHRVSCLLLFWMYVKLTWFESKLPKTERDVQNPCQLPNVSYMIRWSSIPTGDVSLPTRWGCSKLKLMHALNNIECIIIRLYQHTYRHLALPSVLGKISI